MPVQSEWIEDGLISFLKLQSPWTWAEYRAQVKLTFADIIAADRPIATIVDVTRMGKLPPGNFLSELQYVEANMPKNVFLSVIVGAPYVVTAFMNILTKMRPRAKEISRFALSLDEAKIIIKQRHQAITSQQTK